MSSNPKSKALSLLVLGLALSLALVLASCKGSAGPAGPAGAAGAPGAAGAAGAAGASTGTVSGTVTSGTTNAPVSGVTVTLDPAVAGLTVTSSATGAYTATLPIGNYTLTFKKANYTDGKVTVSVTAAQTQTKNLVMQPTAKVVVNAGADVASTPGGSVTLTAAVDALDGTTATKYEWKQIAGAPATIASAAAASTSVKLGDAAAYKAELLHDLEIQNRNEVVAINPHALSSSTQATFRVTVSTSSGTYSDLVVVNVPAAFSVNGGLENVPTGVPVLVNGKTATSYSWSVVGPTGSTAKLSDANTANPFFTPDVSGKYTLSNGSTKLDVYAGTWTGAISGLDATGRPTSDNCTVCHNSKPGALAPDKFTDWAKSGHAEILTNNLNTSATYSEACFQCHSVGFNKDAAAKNGGFDDAADFAGFMSGGILGKPNPDNFKNTIAKFPKAASLANIQCENCHGPNSGNGLHPNSTIDPVRVSISADVCGACHGEPARHGRFQQWESSRHANFELATTRYTSNSCVRCHVGQGFLLWIKQANMALPLQGASGGITVAELAAKGITADTAEPVTCAVCHEPHNVGTTSGEPNNARVRIVDNTSMLPSGYKALGVGKGALCATCHNTRNALHEDGVGLPPSYSAPHTAAQADMLMGENAYFVQTGSRSPHSFIKDTCVTCHMELTPPPAEFSYNLAGTNHSFKASTAICTQCHGQFDGGTLEKATHEKLEELGTAMSKYLLSKIGAQVQLMDYTPHTFGGKSYDIKSTNTTIDKSNIASVTPTEPHGQQGFLVKFKTPVTFTYAPAGEATHTVSLSEAEVQLGDFTTDGTAKLIPLSDPLVRVGWNFFLVEGDGSFGVHNPTFTFNVIERSIDALK